MRTFKTPEESPQLHRSSYQGDGDAVRCWLESARVLEPGIEGLVQDSAERRISLVLEGVHIVPNNHLLDLWRKKGGNALGVVLYIKDAEAHKKLIYNRGEHTTKENADKQIKMFERIRAIHDEMVQLGKACGWMNIETNLNRDPVEVVSDVLNTCELL